MMVKDNLGPPVVAVKWQRVMAAVVVFLSVSASCSTSSRKNEAVRLVLASKPNGHRLEVTAFGCEQVDDLVVLHGAFLLGAPGHTVSGEDTAIVMDLLSNAVAIERGERKSPVNSKELWFIRKIDLQHGVVEIGCGSKELKQLIFKGLSKETMSSIEAFFTRVTQLCTGDAFQN